MSGETSPIEHESKPTWQPLRAIDRRVVGVLIEKAKTTPDAYPLSLNATRTGCNQKSNRYPAMQLTEEEVEDSLQRLRHLGAVTSVQGSSRVERYRHEMYRWLGVDKVELGVMAELLLRGAQTVGELRGRAARMESIADLNALTPLLESLKAKGLVFGLNREGRGHVVTHALYQPAELEKLRGQFADSASPPGQSTDSSLSATGASPSTVQSAQAVTSPPATPSNAGSVASFRNELEWVRAQIQELRDELDDLRAAHDQAAEDLRRLKDSLGA